MRLAVIAKGKTLKILKLSSFRGLRKSRASSILHVSAFSLQADPARSLLGQLTGQNDLLDAVNDKPFIKQEKNKLHDLETIEQSLKMLTTVLTLYARSLPSNTVFWNDTTPAKLFRQHYAIPIDKIINYYLAMQNQTVIIRSR